MPWSPPWSRRNPRDLPSYVTKGAYNSLPPMEENWWDLTVHEGREAAVRSLYDQLCRSGIRYVPEVLSLDEMAPVQEIRSPSEVLRLERAGTCLDLATTFCGLCLWIKLLPVIVVLETHALVAVSRVHGAEQWSSWDRQQGEPAWSEGEVTDADVLRQLVDSGRYVLVECTGFAESEAMPETVPEGRGRVNGVLDFAAACAAGRAQLDVGDRPLRFAMDIATAWKDWGITPREDMTVVPSTDTRERIHSWNADATKSASQRFAAASEWARAMRGQRVVGPELPNLGAKFRDRSDQRARIRTLLGDRETRMVSVIGPGGMGKTNLVGLVVNALVDDPATDTAVITLSARVEGGITLERVFDALTRVLDGQDAGDFETAWRSPHRSPAEKIDAMLQAVRDRKIIIVWDNVELLLRRPPEIGFQDPDLVEFLACFLQQPRSCTLVVCSRQPVPLPEGLTRFEESVQLDEGLDSPDAVALLRDLDPNGRTSIVDADDDTLQELASLTGGNPWGLTRVFGTLQQDPFQTAPGLLTLLREKPDPLLDLARETFDRLAVDGRAVVVALAVFGRPVVAEAIRHVLEPYAPTVQVEAALAGLVRSDYVVFDRADRTYALHRLDQHVALERLDAQSQPTRREAEATAATWWAALCQPLAPDFCALDLEPYLQRFSHLVRARDAEHASALLDDLDVEEIVFSGWVKQIFDMCHQLEGLDLSPRDAARRQYALALCHRVLGPLHVARDLFSAAAGHAREAGDDRTLRLAEGWLGEVHSLLGDQQAALLHLEAALTLHQQADDLASVTWTQGELILRHTYAGDPSRGLSLYARASAVAPDVETAEARMARGIGLLHDGACLANLALGRLDEAVEAGQTALRWFARVREQYISGYVHNMLGLVDLEHDRREEAIGHFEQAVALTLRDGYRRVEALARHNHAFALLIAGRAPEASQRCTEALAALDSLDEGSSGVLPERAATSALTSAVEAALRGDSAALDTALARCAEVSAATPDLLHPRAIRRFRDGGRRIYLRDVGVDASTP